MANENELPKDVFISYTTRGDADYAQRLCDILEAAGVGCWIAPRDIEQGKDWADIIPNAISQSKLMALLVSDASMGSEEIKKEINLANSRKKTILPIRLEKVGLRDAFEYHLGPKQWVDAYEGDFETRFQATSKAILKLTGAAGASVTPVVVGGVAARAQELVRALNRKHEGQFTKVNAFLSLRVISDQHFSVRFPVRIGSSGVDLELQFDMTKQPVMLYDDPSVTNTTLKWPFISVFEFYADLSSMDAPLKKPFINSFKEHFSKQFGDQLEVNSASRRRKIFRFLELKFPHDQFLPFTQDYAYEIFERHVRAFVERVLPPLLDWMEYGRLVLAQLTLLNDKISVMFPTEKGWKVEAPQGQRLVDCYSNGGLNIYRKTWAPKDNFRKRGLLSIRIHTDPEYLGAVSIGVCKFDDSIELGEVSTKIADNCTRLAGAPTYAGGEWIWNQWLAEPWRNSGIATGEARWKDNPEGFNREVLSKLEQLREIIPLIDEACQKLPAMQIQPVESLADSAWTPIFIRSWFAYAAQHLNDKFVGFNSELKTSWDYQYRKAWSGWPPRVHAQIKVGSFDFALIISCDQKTMVAELKSLEPPHFEAEVIKNFLTKRLPDFPMENRNVLMIKKLSVGMEFDGATPQDWMQRFINFAVDQVTVSTSALKAIYAHLISTLALVDGVKMQIMEIFPAGEGWRVRDEASSLDQIEGGFLIWNANWQLPNTLPTPEDMPPIVFTLGSYHRLFDAIYLGVRLTEPLSENIVAFEFGAILGACQMIFGKGGQQEGYPWRSDLPNGFNQTGATSFDARTLIDGEERQAFLMYVREQLLAFKRMEPLFRAANQKIITTKSVLPSASEA